MSESNGIFDFDKITRKTQTVKYGGQNFTLFDASEKATIEYDNARRKVIVEGEEIRFIPHEPEKASSVLVANCLYDGKNQPVPLEDLRKWPHHAIETMFEWIVENSPGMRRKETREEIEEQIEHLQKRLKKIDAPGLEEQAKNSPNATAVS